MSRKPLPSVIDFFYLYGIPNHSFDWQTRRVFGSRRLCEETPDTHAVTHRKLIGLFPGPTTVTGSTDSEKWKNHSFPARKQTPPSLPELWNSKSSPQNSWMGWETSLCLGEARWDTEIKGRKERRKERKYHYFASMRKMEHGCLGSPRPPSPPMPRAELVYRYWLFLLSISSFLFIMFSPLTLKTVS